MKNAEHIFFITLAVISGIFIDRCPIAAKTPPLYSTTATSHSDVSANHGKTTASPSTTAASHCTTTTDRNNAETRHSDVPANHGKTTASHSTAAAGYSKTAIIPSNNTTGCLSAPGIREALPFGDFEQWTIRRIKESAIVGKDSVTVYEIDRNQTIYGNIPYSNTDSPWATSNAFAKVMGVVKTNVNVRPAPHITRAENSSNGNSGERCAEMRTEIMSFKVLGMAKVEVLTAGAIYLGKLKEPINSMDNAIKSVNIGIPFTKRPKYLVFDYKATIRNSGTVSRSTMTKRTDMPGRDKAIATVQLQKRTEKDGKIYAERVATGELLIGGSCDWRHGAKLKLTYGKPENEEALSQFSRLNSFFYAENSSGESVPIQETGWADPDTAPTHLIIYFASGYLGPFTGEIGNSLSIDNVMLEY
ncbi:MAG: PCMD domain-containing protein [Muribaculum sp.]|uniref:PCMD domain-containing protein n=1 Tax=Candidatus Merdivivens faecigallinarum TaxID=2840871 RepID=A0A9D9J2K9_9BACT|nr:PCMD domain-containing protein [Candidatus Merdivivens faecigallinarum]